MDKRTKLYMNIVIPVKHRLRKYAIYMMKNAIDRLDIDKCRRYDNAVTFIQFINDDELFMSDDFLDDEF